MKYKNPEELKRAIDKYLSNGDIEFVPSFFGFRKHLGLSTNEWDELADGMLDNDKQKYAVLIEMAVLQIAAFVEVRIFNKSTYNPGLRELLKIINDWLNRKNKNQIEEEENAKSKEKEIADLVKKFGGKK